MRRMTITSLLLISLLPAIARGQQNETLAQVLRQNSVAVDSGAVPHHLNDAITSYATLNTKSEFLIAYYLLTADSELHSPLLLTRFDKQADKWEEASLTGSQMKLPDGTEPETDCIGSAQRFERNGNWYYLDLSLTPSAGCLMILNHDLTVHQILAGWTAAFFPSGLLVYEGNMVQFAPVHPATLFIYNPDGGKSQKIYPPENDPFRRDFSERLKKIIDVKQCQENNWPCDPNEFESTIVYPIEVNDETRSLAFRVAFDTQGFLMPQDAKASGEWHHDQHVYVYQLNPMFWREFRADELKAKFGTDSLKGLLTSGKLREVFATASPR